MDDQRFIYSTYLCSEFRLACLVVLQLIDAKPLIIYTYLLALFTPIILGDTYMHPTMFLFEKKNCLRSLRHPTMHVHHIHILC